MTANPGYWDLSKQIMEFIRERPEGIGIDSVEDFFKSKIKEPSDITEKELYEYYFRPYVQLRKAPEFHAHAMLFQAYSTSRYLYNDFDYISVVCGTEGKGKSTWTLIASELLKKLGVNYKFEDIIFRGTPVEKVLEVISESKMSTVWMDEAKAFFDKRMSMATDQVELIQEVTAQRKNNNVLRLCIGSVEEVDKYFRERRAREVVIIPDRKIFITLLNMGIVGMGEDRFRLDMLNWIITSAGRLDYREQISRLASLPSAHVVGHFNRAPQELFDAYKILKEGSNSHDSDLRRLAMAQKRQRKHDLLMVAAEKAKYKALSMGD
mgnify:CR=1 FL=1